MSSIINIFQVVLSKFESERDDAISKISRVLENTSSTEDIEKYLENQFRLLTIANLNIESVKVEFDKLIKLEKESHPPSHKKQ